MILFLDTTDRKRITVGLVDEGRMKKKIEERGEFQQSEKLLPLINKLLRKNKIMLADLSGIIVVSGPGGFTSVRIGVIAANTLGFVLRIPVAGVPKPASSTIGKLIKEGLKKLKGVNVGEIALPFYGAEPNITKPKGSMN